MYKIVTNNFFCRSVVRLTLAYYLYKFTFINSIKYLTNLQGIHRAVWSFVAIGEKVKAPLFSRLYINAHVKTKPWYAPFPQVIKISSMNSKSYNDFIC